MKKAIKKKWLKALRSGEFKQGRRILYNTQDNSFCCLGVLCDLAMLEGVCDFEKDTSHAGFVKRYGRFDEASTHLPDSVKEWAQVSYSESKPLIVMNDDGKSFDAIADYIEANL